MRRSGDAELLTFKTFVQDSASSLNLDTSMRKSLVSVGKADMCPPVEAKAETPCTPSEYRIEGASSCLFGFPPMVLALSRIR